MTGTSNTFQLDARLQADTIPIGNKSDIEILLMNDGRWPWIILVPRVVGANDLDDLDDAIVTTLTLLSARSSSILKNLNLATSTNVATLSNVVTQFHQHIVGRNEGDPNWPSPIWGFGKCVPYQKDRVSELVKQLRAEFSEEVKI